MSNTTRGIPPQATRPVPWRTDQLPPVVHELETVDGRRLAVRVIRPGDRFGLSATLDGTPLVEVRRPPQESPYSPLPSDLVAVWDLTLFLEDPRAHWVILTAGTRFACTEEALCDMFASVHEYGVTRAAD